MKSVVISYHFCLYVKKTWKTAHRLWNGEHNGTHPTRCTRHQRIKKEMLDIPAWRLRDYKRKNVWQKKNVKKTEVWSTILQLYLFSSHPFQKLCYMPLIYLDQYYYDGPNVILMNSIQSAGQMCNIWTWENLYSLIFVKKKQVWLLIWVDQWLIEYSIIYFWSWLWKICVWSWLI